MDVPKLTLLEAIQFLVEPLHCEANYFAIKLLKELTPQNRGSTVLLGQAVLETVSRVTCDLHIRPGLIILIFAIGCFIMITTLRNACMKLVRWYAAARGSAFVAIATQALRELHTSGVFLASGTSSGGCSGDDGACLPRPASSHRWYTPQSVTAPVVCCGCFQPVVVAQGVEGRAQCCELCGMVAHGSCIKVVPQSCRLLALEDSPPPPPPHSSPPPPQLPPPLPHDWRPAGTTLDLILPPADTEMLLTGGGDSGGGPQGNGASASSSSSFSHGPPSLCLYCGVPCEVGLLAVEPVWRCGGCRRFAHVQCWSCLHPGALSAVTRAALEGQTMEVEEITGSPRGTSLQWDALRGSDSAPLGATALADSHAATSLEAPGTTSRSTRRGGGGSPLMAYSKPSTAVETEVDCRGRSNGATSSSCTFATGGGKANGGWSQRTSARAMPPSHSTTAAATPLAGCIRPKPQAAEARYTGGSKGSIAALQPLSIDTWDRHRRCQSLPNIADQDGNGGNRSSGGAGGGSGSNCYTVQPDYGGGMACDTGAVSPPVPGYGGAAVARGGDPRGSAVDVATAEGELLREEALPRRDAGKGIRRPTGSLGRLAQLDRCDPQASLGILGAMVVPPTAVLPIVSRLKFFLPSRPSKVATGSAVPAAGCTASTALASAGGSSGGSSRNRKKLQKQHLHLGRSLRQQAQQWYRSHAAGWSRSAAMSGADVTSPDRWRHFRIGALPPGCKPLLVFINPRSGPQAGEQLRRQLLQLLHPMQIVDLVREGPAAALRCWWGVPGLRVLVVGGDGTAGWILGEIETVAAELGAAAAVAAVAAGQQGNGNGNSNDEANGAGAVLAAPPPPPPVAVLPLGTGNDLARVLGWGGGMAALDARGGVAAVLAEVAAAAPTPLDRWALTIAIMPQEPVRQRSSFLPRQRQPPSISASRGQPPQPVVQAVKMYNNYLGVGIDSWCALEFHRMRERYPGWFRSQLGNKMWYTGVGARDLLARSCVDLPARLTLHCDGRAIELPAATQGILFLSIPSYMGGVDLWGNGISQQQLLQGTATGGGGGAGGSGGGSGSGRDRGAESCSPEMYGIAGGCGGGTACNVGSVPGSAASAISIAGAGGVITASRRAGAGGGCAGGGGGGGGSPPAGASGSARAASADAPQVQQLPLHLQLSHSMLQLQQSQPEVPQSISDGMLEVVVVYGAVHLGQLQVGLARATRLCQCRTAVITTLQELPMQVDGEPWMQPAAQLNISIKGSAVLLRRLDLSSATARLTAAVGEVLDGAMARGTITAVQRQTLGTELAQRLGARHAV